MVNTDNVCTCGHEWGSHFINGKLLACSLNQSVCDCWGFAAKKIERNEIFDLQINITKGRDKMYLQSKREYVKMNPFEKALIVARIEASLGNAIIDPLRMACLEGCRCENCFQRALDLLVNKTEIMASGEVDKDLDLVD